MPKKSLNDWLMARDISLHVKADVVPFGLMTETLKTIYNARGKSELGHGYGRLAQSVALYLEWCADSQEFILRPDPNDGVWHLKLHWSMCEGFIKNLGLVKGDIKSLFGHRFVCLFAQDHSDQMPDLRRISLMTIDHREFLDRSASDLTGPLRPWMFGMDISSIKTNVWF